MNRKLEPQITARAKYPGSHDRSSVLSGVLAVSTPDTLSHGYDTMHASFGHRGSQSQPRGPGPTTGSPRASALSRNGVAARSLPVGGPGRRRMPSAGRRLAMAATPHAPGPGAPMG